MPGQVAQPSVDGNCKKWLSMSKIGGGGHLRPPDPPQTFSNLSWHILLLHYILLLYYVDY